MVNNEFVVLTLLTGKITRVRILLILKSFKACYTFNTSVKSIHLLTHIIG